jgi:DNA-binding NarL/FixJ family response regulator
MTATKRRLPELLLLEPESMMRGTVVAVARQLNLAEVQASASVPAAARLLGDQLFEAVIVAVDDDGDALTLLGQLRSRAFRSDAATPIVVMTHQCDMELVVQLKALDVRRVVLKPCKVKTILEVIASLAAVPTAI